MSVFFITGATGAVGSALCEKLLQTQARELRLLIRADDDTQLQQRLDTLFNFWALPLDHPARTRVTALRGDAALPRFGLAADEYDRLIVSVTHTSG